MAILPQQAFTTRVLASAKKIRRKYLKVFTRLLMKMKNNFRVLESGCIWGVK
jgi:hypothetical protein